MAHRNGIIPQRTTIIRQSLPVTYRALAQAALAEDKRIRTIAESSDAQRSWHVVQIAQSHFTKT